jgi:cytosine/uracil/thiamine/allantoin permease
MNFKFTKAKTVVSIVIGIFMSFGGWLTKGIYGGVKYAFELQEFIFGLIMAFVVYIIWSLNQKNSRKKK